MVIMYQAGPLQLNVICRLKGSVFPKAITMAVVSWWEDETVRYVRHAQTHAQCIYSAVVASAAAAVWVLAK